MKMRYLAVGLVAVGALSAGGVLMGGFGSAVDLPVADKAELAPRPVVTLPRITDLPAPRPVILLPRITDLPEPVITIDTPVTAAEMYPDPWSREIAPGETLDAILREAGLTPAERAEAARAIGKEYDLRRLRPGHTVTVEVDADGQPARVALAVSDGMQIEAALGETWVTQVLVEEPEITTIAKEARVRGSVSATLSNAGIPSRFAVDLVDALGGKVDFRRELQGGEVLKLMWEEARIESGRVGQPSLSFVSLDLGGRTYEAVWDKGSRPLVFEDGEVVRTFAKPVGNARLSSTFGPREHPIHGGERMHEGVDFAAPTGTPVRATAPGRVSFTGRRGGYGIVVEISHGASTTTRYAHLSKVEKGLKRGARVDAGETIGRVGSTGNSTGPHLHYEVRVNGRAIDPLENDQLAEAIRRGDMDSDALTQLKAARAAVGKYLTTAVASLGVRGE